MSSLLSPPRALADSSLAALVSTMGLDAGLVSVRQVSHGRGVFASKAINPGVPVLSIPLSQLLTPSSLCPLFRDALDAHLAELFQRQQQQEEGEVGGDAPPDPFFVLMSALLYECHLRHVEQSSEGCAPLCQPPAFDLPSRSCALPPSPEAALLASYYSTLLPLSTSNFPLQWPPGKAESLGPLFPLSSLLAAQRRLVSSTSSLLLLSGVLPPGTPPSDATAFVTWCSCVLNSRCMDLSDPADEPEAKPPLRCLCPFADLLNHSSGDTSLSVQVSRAGVSFVSRCEIPEGAEITLEYSSNLDECHSLCNYGFLLRGQGQEGQDSGASRPPPTLYAPADLTSTPASQSSSSLSASDSLELLFGCLSSLGLSSPSLKLAVPLGGPAGPVIPDVLLWALRVKYMSDEQRLAFLLEGRAEVLREQEEEVWRELREMAEGWVRAYEGGRDEGGEEEKEWEEFRIDVRREGLERAKMILEAVEQR